MKLNKKSLSGSKSSCQSSSAQSGSGCGCSTKKGSIYEEDIDVEISE